MLSFSCLLGLASQSSCITDPDIVNFVSFELDGITWQSDTAFATVGQDPNVFTLTLQARNPQGEVLQIELFEFKLDAIGSYVISPNNFNSLKYDPDGQIDGNSLDAVQCALVSGDIQITSIDELVISGIFQGDVCAGSQFRQIRNGRFENVLISP